MSSTSNAAINLKLQQIFTNGRIEVGLEVGSDPGLAEHEFIQIPKRFERAWAYSTVAEPDYRPTAGVSVEEVSKQYGWKTVKPGEKLVRIHKGEYFVVDPNDTNPQKLEHFYRRPYSVEDVKQFIVLNTGHVRDDVQSVEQAQWIHAVRFWSVAAGFVRGTKQAEWKVVDDAPDTSSVTDEYAKAVIEMCGSALTACAARAASWRKSNHATGGDIASGFPRRWLSKSGYWPIENDANVRKDKQRAATGAFYVATHASCVHPILAMMAPDDHAHWALLDPVNGMIMHWDVLESTSIRIAPKTQVAGTAIVVDSMVVLKMLVSEGLAPLLESNSQVEALVSAYRKVETNGVQVASYASWFLDGHPENMKKVAFAQKDAAFSALAGELATVGRNFYRGSTIGESLALENAMQQLATETAKTRWKALARARKSATNDVIMTVYTRVMGASVGQALANLSSSDVDSVRQGVTAYNRVSQTIAELIKVTDPVMLDNDKVIANMNVTPGSSAADVDDDE